MTTLSGKSPLTCMYLVIMPYSALKHLEMALTIAPAAIVQLFPIVLGPTTTTLPPTHTFWEKY